MVVKLEMGSWNGRKDNNFSVSWRKTIGLKSAKILQWIKLRRLHAYVFHGH